ncbi:hypothetical protein JZ751_010249 [Albula glossodonta]|uniref:Uncharacterized protein n=1 Tax=Albula glossodonta TaxID=121402 RepID=A0A8T2N7H1_9TELE|nr:hypothetical protein JZ751_010249 [Albula glossodonta]
MWDNLLLAFRLIVAAAGTDDRPFAELLWLANKMALNDSQETLLDSAPEEIELMR